ncbi:MAG: dihydrolipoamide succinyltransferase, partial [Gammaproteobacteria bacterium]
MKTVLCSLAMASLVAGASAQAEDDVLERIKPVGQVNIAGKTAAAPAAQAAAPAAATPAAPAAAPASAP